MNTLIFGEHGSGKTHIASRMQGEPEHIVVKRYAFEGEFRNSKISYRLKGKDVARGKSVGETAIFEDLRDDTVDVVMEVANRHREAFANGTCVVLLSMFDRIIEIHMVHDVIRDMISNV